MQLKTANIEASYFNRRMNRSKNKKFTPFTMKTPENIKNLQYQKKSSQIATTIPRRIIEKKDYRSYGESFERDPATYTIPKAPKTAWAPEAGGSPTFSRSVKEAPILSNSNDDQPPQSRNNESQKVVFKYVGGKPLYKSNLPPLSSLKIKDLLSPKEQPKIVITPSNAKVTHVQNTVVLTSNLNQSGSAPQICIGPFPQEVKLDQISEIIEGFFDTYERQRPSLTVAQSPNPREMRSVRKRSIRNLSRNDDSASNRGRQGQMIANPLNQSQSSVNIPTGKNSSSRQPHQSKMGKYAQSGTLIRSGSSVAPPLAEEPEPTLTVELNEEVKNQEWTPLPR